MSRGLACYSACSPPRIHQFRSTVNPRDASFFVSNLKLVSTFPKLSLRCNSTGDSGENESRTILDAFFLGKAVAEAINERVESTLGEMLSTIGRLQAEQQKQIQEFQEEVLERARRGKEQAMEAQGVFPKPTAPAAEESSKLSVNGVETTKSPPASEPADMD